MSTVTDEYNSSGEDSVGMSGCASLDLNIEVFTEMTHAVDLCLLVTRQHVGIYKQYLVQINTSHKTVYSFFASIYIVFRYLKQLKSHCRLANVLMHCTFFGLWML